MDIRHVIVVLGVGCLDGRIALQYTIELNAIK
jgi:hypothetical protein